jgi:uncharacterized protein YbbC (DUF1343 family)
MKFGIDRLISEPDLRRPLKGQRLALVAHPASATVDLRHSLDALAALPDLRVTAAFGPQHGLRGDKQDNMIESPDFHDPLLGVPVHSLYGTVRRPTDAMLDSFDTLLIDLQDIGCRVYTFITTLRYLLEDCARKRKAVWVLDRPNPAGRPVEGLLLDAGWESFVGAGSMPMRHGLTMGELARWFVATLRLDVELQVIEMQGWEPAAAPGYGWPLHERSWINPSPNAPNLSMVRCYAGTVMIEGTTLSEGRGTTRPLELVGAPQFNARATLAWLDKFAPQWLTGCTPRICWFEPTFHKHVGELCNGIQLHVDAGDYHHAQFHPWRLLAAILKAQRALQPERVLWRDFAYEYEQGRCAFDVINGGPRLRQWIEDPRASAADLEAMAAPEERSWLEARADALLYRS